MRQDPSTAHLVRGNALFTKPGMRQIVAGVIVLQVVVPVVAFFQEPPTRLGWQMYSGVGEIPEIRIETEGGVARKIPFSDVAASSRPELGWHEHLPAHVCDVFPETTAVDLIIAGAEHSFECDS